MDYFFLTFYVTIMSMKLWKLLFWFFIGVVILFAVLSAIFSPKSEAQTNIDSEFPYYVGRDNIVGEWNFFSSGNVVIGGTRIEGWALSTSNGSMALDCAITPNGNICDEFENPWGICNGPGPKLLDGSCSGGDASGTLTGFAWNDVFGWISFNCNQTSHGGQNYCGTLSHEVGINTTNGDFYGYAYNPILGQISFNCLDPGVCGDLEDYDYKVGTYWRGGAVVGFLDSAIFDTKIQGGAALNSIIWHGEKPEGTEVYFQIAASNDEEGPWNFKGPYDTGQEDDYYGGQCPHVGPGSTQPGKPVCVDPSIIGEKTYLRYRVRLESNMIQTLTPEITDIILNWSP